MNYFQKSILSIALLLASLNGFSQNTIQRPYTSSIGLNIYSSKASRHINNDGIYYPSYAKGISYKYLRRKVNFRFSLNYFEFFYGQKITQKISSTNMLVTLYNGKYSELIPKVGLEKTYLIKDRIQLIYGVDFSIGHAIDTMLLTSTIVNKEMIPQNRQLSRVVNDFKLIEIAPLVGISTRIGKRFWITVETSINFRVNMFQNPLSPLPITSPLPAPTNTLFDPIAFLGIYYDLNIFK